MNNGTEFVHQYSLNVSPDGRFTGTGDVVGYGIDETISGNVSGSTVTFDAAYLNGSDYTWHSSGTDSDGRTFIVTNTLTTSDYKNHGDYVSSQGGGADAAHSPIGMPTNSNQ